MLAFLSEGLLVALLAVHLAAVNLGAAAPLLCIGLRRRSQKLGEPLADRAAYQLAVTALVTTTAGMVLGAGLLAIVWRDPNSLFMRGIARFPTERYLNAGFEIVFYYAMIGLYVGLWNQLKHRPVVHGLLAVMASSNLMYHFPPLMVMIATVPARPELAETMIDSATYRTLLLDPEIASRVIHSWIASCALAGLATMGLAVRCGNARDNQSHQNLSRWGARVALTATLIQPIVGIWVLMNLPAPAQYGLLGDDLLGTLILAGAVTATLGLLHLLATAAMAGADRTLVVRSIVLGLLIVTLMAGTVRRARHAAHPNSAWPTERDRQFVWKGRSAR